MPWLLERYSRSLTLASRLHQPFSEHRFDFGQRLEIALLPFSISRVIQDHLKLESCRHITWRARHRVPCAPAHVDERQRGVVGNRDHDRPESPITIARNPQKEDLARPRRRFWNFSGGFCRNLATD
jgi:hypothetical protein